ncbi:MAG: hypothetical protein QM767_29670 [Anaeromyxobacter sp.]
MKVSGFTFVRDAVRFSYPVVAAIRSILPLCDELVVNVGVSQDGTLDLVRSIDDPRLVIFESTWDEGLRKGGAILAQQTDLALDRCTGDVGIYVQADEAMHEDDHPAVRAALERLHQDPRAEGLLFDYVHFYGSFHTVGVARRWYRREVRAVKLGVGVRSWRDAQGFRIGEGPSARKLAVLPAGARMYHYGWVRPPEAMGQKAADFHRWYHGDEVVRRAMERQFTYDVEERVRPFTGTHPGPMRDHVAAADWPFTPRPQRLVRRGRIRRDLLDLLERATGVRLGEYRNYREL